MSADDEDFAAVAHRLAGHVKKTRAVNKKSNKERRKERREERQEEQQAQAAAAELIEVAEHCDECHGAEHSEKSAAAGQKTIEAIIDIARQLWKKVLAVAKDNVEFKEWPDKRKLQYFRDMPENVEFMNEFPIVSRYMICMGQFKTKALRRMLEKMSRTIDPPVAEQPKNYREDLFCRRQADYIRFLWEEFQTRINTEEAKYVWQDAYQRLKGEFNDFRDMYDETKKRVEDEKGTYKALNARELLERLSTGLQQLPEEDMRVLLGELEAKADTRRMNTWREEHRAITTANKLYGELLRVRPRCEVGVEGVGCGPEERAPLTEEEERRTIRMIEHVDPDRISEVPRNLIIDPETDPHLRRMREMQNNAVEV